MTERLIQIKGTGGEREKLECKRRKTKSKLERRIERKEERMRQRKEERESEVKVRVLRGRSPLLPG